MGLIAVVRPRGRGGRRRSRLHPQSLAQDGAHNDSGAHGVADDGSDANGIPDNGGDQDRFDAGRRG